MNEVGGGGGPYICLGRIFQTEGGVDAEALKWKHSGCLSRSEGPSAVQYAERAGRRENARAVRPGL